ncbi:hypothetical protein MGMO_19c00020 [Methyloglobulus morosus KoM1]|uniref:Uncharacterized protein n=1 Tax=Methyloglobulus morosus KoM1 TaxID=1116472 RepID=V5C4R5_9GAMM|nr:DUF922 domain-containing protein [Methyloglobulus morosus]ESS73482.1 hypothetical protein MGMO_19c00020 [Methyloglobulus morosus KoM1]
MHFEHDGMRLWVEPNKQLTGGSLKPGSDANLSIGVEPADASNRVQVKYRVNSGSVAAIDAIPVRHVGNKQFFKAQLPCAALNEGDNVEYTAKCQCAGRQVPSPTEAEHFTSSFRIMSVAAADRPASTASFIKPLRATAVESGNTSSDGEWRQSVPKKSKLKPTHLSLFVLDKKTGHPVARMPFYAEVGVVSFVPLPKSECKYREAIIDALFQHRAPERVGLFATIQESTPENNLSLIAEYICDALYRLLAPSSVDSLVDKKNNGLSEIWKNAGALVLATKPPINFPQDDPQAALKLFIPFIEQAILAYAKAHNLPLADTNAQHQKTVWAHPMGVLATDHVGYLSFDLTRLPEDVAIAVEEALESRRREPSKPTETTIWLYSMAREETRIDALSQMRFAHDAIVVKLELEQPHVPESMKNMGLMSMQNPGLIDWRMSPSSFATNPAALLGEDADHCENLYPAHVALQEFNFYQVVGLSDLTPNDLPNGVKLGVAHEYRLAWYPLGHSLGQIQYSLPLAPGESVNLAVIDWTRRDVGTRTEDTKAAEQLTHNQRRDRTITETVNASIKEFQEGSSFMAGAALSAGATFASGGLGLAAGLAGSLGGSSSDSSGSRDIAANTVQKLSDNISQASASMRELQSTVVVQTTQTEKESIETRTIVNYNHSHALTILYYEVLRHFRVVTEFVRRRSVVLTNVHRGIWEERDGKLHILWKIILENRKVLHDALLDSRYEEHLNLVENKLHREKKDIVKNELEKKFNINQTPPQPPLEPPPPIGPYFRFFNVDIKTGGIEAKKDVHIHVTVFGSATMEKYDHTKINLWEGVKLHGENPINTPGSLHWKDANCSVTALLPVGVPPIAWGNIDLIKITVWLQDGDKSETDTAFQHIKITGIDVDGNPTTLVDKNYREPFFEGDIYFGNTGDIWLPTRRPQPVLPPPPPSIPPELIEEEAKIQELEGHLLHHLAHYERALILGIEPAQRYAQLASVHIGSGNLLEKIESRPLEMIDGYIAYPCADSNWSKYINDELDRRQPPEQTSDERLVTLPTRGLFAEAKLGHCNASEEIDNTRFWDWQASPIPHMAPDIEAIKAGQHLVKDLNLQPTAFPQSLLNIVNPPSAPDPTGLASALNVLGTPNIFRDMSGRAEVADLLKKLSDNSISITDAANKAKEIQGKYGANLGAGSVTVGNSPGSQKAKPNEPSRAIRNIQDLRKEIKEGVRDDLLSPEKANEIYEKNIDQMHDLFGVPRGFKNSLIGDPNAIASNDAGFIPSNQKTGDAGVADAGRPDSGANLTCTEKLTWKPVIEVPIDIKADSLVEFSTKISPALGGYPHLQPAIEYNLEFDAQGKVTKTNLMLQTKIVIPRWSGGRPSEKEKELILKYVQLIKSHEERHRDIARQIMSDAVCAMHGKTGENALKVLKEYESKMNKAQDALDAKEGQAQIVFDNKGNPSDIVLVGVKNKP